MNISIYYNKIPVGPDQDDAHVKKHSVDLSTSVMLCG